MAINYPIYFKDNTCPHCGSKSIIFLDKFNRECKNPIYPINYMICTKCKRKFFIQWISDKDTMIPVTTSKDSLTIFENNIVKYSLEHKRKLL